MVDSLPELLTLVVALIAVVAEFQHWKRIGRVKRLAFGPSSRPAAWVSAGSLLRIIGLSAACWGFLSLILVVQAEVHDEDLIPDSDYKHLVLVIDVSPSMHLEDAGPAGEQSRRMRASAIVESVFNRIPMRQFKVTIIGVYSDAKMLVQDSTDFEVVRHIMEDMPMWHAYEPGKTKLLSGIQLAAKAAKNWPRHSSYILMLTDGDTVPATGMPKLPPSIKETFVVGVGDTSAGTFIADHQSRQDTSTLRQIANRLRGVYHDGNEHHLSTQLVNRFVHTEGESRAKIWTRREWSLAAALFGSLAYAAIPLLLHYFGTRYRAGVVRTPQANDLQLKSKAIG